MVEPERVKVDAYIRGLTDNIMGEVTSSKPGDLNEAVRMDHKLMKQKLQARDARILEGKKRNQKQGNPRAMVTAPTDCGKVGHKVRYCKEKSVATGANAQPIWTCYDCGEQGHTRSRCLKKVKQEKGGEARGQAYAIKDAEPQGLNVVTGVSRLKVISCIKARKYVERGCHLFWTYVIESKSKEKGMENVYVIRNFPEVFPEEFPGLPLQRQVEFRIDLVPGVAPVERAPYRLALSKVKELLVQLQELLEKVFVRSSSSPWGAPVLFVKKRWIF
nr:putative reverse transcriptase domain-containing protein [Tanacetum cinerariifolium]